MEKSLSQNSSGNDGLLDNIEVSIRCDKCGTELREKVSRLKGCNTVSCSCGFIIDTRGVRAKAMFVEEAINEFRLDSGNRKISSGSDQ